jgi:hypothetical protein
MDSGATLDEVGDKLDVLREAVSTLLEEGGYTCYLP